MISLQLRCNPRVDNLTWFILEAIKGVSFAMCATGCGIGLSIDLLWVRKCQTLTSLGDVVHECRIRCGKMGNAMASASQGRCFPPASCGSVSCHLFEI